VPYKDLAGATQALQAVGFDLFPSSARNPDRLKPVLLKNMTIHLNDANEMAILNGEPSERNDGSIAPLDGSSAGGGFTTSGSQTSLNAGAARAPLGIDGKQPAANAQEALAKLTLGPNNERLEDLRPDLVNALRELVVQYREEGIVARRHEIRRIRQARLFWQGLQYAWWNPQDMTWHLPYESKIYDDSAAAEMPRYQFVTNLYQAFGLSFISILSQDVPATNDRPATLSAKLHEPAALWIEPGARFASSDWLSKPARQSRLFSSGAIGDHQPLAVGAVLLF
jgi:hypothetical protein